jgi:hypothetical protein
VANIWKKMCVLHHSQKIDLLGIIIFYSYRLQMHKIITRLYRYFAFHADSFTYKVNNNNNNNNNNKMMMMMMMMMSGTSALTGASRR